METERPRMCLICKKSFPSAGPANRICKRCKKSRRHLKTIVEAMPMDDLAYPHAERLVLDMELRSYRTTSTDDPPNYAPSLSLD